MNQALSTIFSLLRPEDEDFSPEARSQIQLNRLLSLLGALLVFFLGSLYAAYNPTTTTNPAWVRLGVAGLFLGLVAGSYASKALRRTYVGGLRVLLYVLLGWFAIVASANGFAGDYDMGLLLLYAILPVVVGVGARSAGPVLRFLGYGFLLGVGGAIVGPAPWAEVLVLTGSLATVALVEGVAFQAWLSTQKQLEEREDQLRSINENISDGIYRSTPEEGLVYANQAFAEMLGYESTEKMYEVDPRKLYACAETRRRLREKAKNQGGFEPTEVELQRVDGTTFPALLSATVLRDEEGAVQYYDGAVTDITEQKRTEELLRERETRLRGLANSIPGVVYQFCARPDGTYGHHFVSEHAEEVLGISADPDGFYERVMERVPASHRDELEASIDRAVSEERPWQFEAPYVKPSGERIWLLGTSTPDVREDELVFNGVILDVTERREAERKLRQSEQRFRGVFENAANGIAILDVEGRLLDVNPALGKMTGYAPGELQGRHFADITHPDDLEADQKRYEELVGGERDRYQMEKRFVRKEGGVFWGRLTVSRHEGGEEAQVVGMVEDIDDQKRYEKNLREAKEEAERMNRMKSSFLANMSHEIRTPLTSIIGFAEAIGEEVSGTEEGSVPRFARLIAKGGRRLLETLDGVLNLSKLEAGELEVSPEPTNLAVEVEEATELFEPQAEEDDLELRAETEGNTVWAHADGRGLRMVLRNLITNALKYTEEGGEVRVRAREEETAAVLEVEDTGVGMAPEAVSELFEPFRQESEGVSREYEGSGIGLAVTKRAVDQMGGSIEVETEKGNGTCFTIRLPQAEAEPEGR